MIMSFWPTSFTEDNNNSKKKKRSTSLEQNKENTHTGSLKKREIKRVGGYFVAVVLCHRFLLFVGKIETQRIFEVRM